MVEDRRNKKQEGRSRKQEARSKKFTRRSSLLLGSVVGQFYSPEFRFFCGTQVEFKMHSVG